VNQSFGDKFETMFKSAFRKITAAFYLLKGWEFRRLYIRSIKPLIVSRWSKGLRKLLRFRAVCGRFPSGITILSDGSLTTCCVDIYGKSVFGSVYKRDLSDIWQNEITPLIQGGDLYDIKLCRSCIFARAAESDAEFRQWKSTQYPEMLQLEAMAKCNYGCCHAVEMYKYRSTKCDLDKVFENIKSILPKIKRLVFSGSGEVLLHEGFCVFIAKCRRESSLFEMHLLTNGMLMNEDVSRCMIDSRVEMVIISIHRGPGTENMLKYSRFGADYEVVLANIRRLAELKKEKGSVFPKIIAKAILFNWNDSDESIDRLKSDARASGADEAWWCRDGMVLPRSSKRFATDAGIEQMKQYGFIINTEKDAFICKFRG